MPSASLGNVPLGESLRVWRTARGLTLGQVALKANITKACLSRWESGARTPDASCLEAVLAALNIPEAERRACFARIERPGALLRLKRMHDSGDSPLSGGELLRALRLRAGVAQADAARAVGVSRTMLSRWENGDAWPDDAQTHALCHALGATVEETAMLTTRRFREMAPLPSETYALIQAYVHLTYQDRNADKDLGYLAISSRFAWLESRGKTERRELSKVWGCHAYHLHLVGDRDRAGTLAARALADAANEPELGPGHVQAVSVLAQVAAGQEGPQSAYQVVEGWLPRIRNRQSRNWMRSLMSGYLADAGFADAALQLSAQVVREEEKERFQRWLDHVRLLLRTGRVVEAQRSLPHVAKSLPGPDLGNPDEWRVDLELLSAETLFAAGQTAEATRHLDAADRLIRSNPNGTPARLPERLRRLREAKQD